MFSDYQLNVPDDYNTPIGNVEKLVPNIFEKKMHASLEKLETLFKTRPKNKKCNIFRL